MTQEVDDFALRFSAVNKFGGGWKKATKQKDKLYCLSEFLAVLRGTLSRTLSPDSEELLDALSKGFRGLHDGEQPALFKRAVRSGLSAQEVRRRVYLRIGYDLVFDSLLGSGKSKLEAERKALKKTLKYARDYKIQPKTRGQKEQPKESLQHALTNLVARSREKKKNSEADEIYRSTMVLVKVLQAGTTLYDQSLPNFYFEEYLPMLLGLKSKTPNWRIRFLNEEPDLAKAEVTLKSMRRKLSSN